MFHVAPHSLILWRSPLTENNSSRKIQRSNLPSRASVTAQTAFRLIPKQQQWQEILPLTGKNPEQDPAHVGGVFSWWTGDDIWNLMFLRNRSPQPVLQISAETLNCWSLANNMLRPVKNSYWACSNMSEDTWTTSIPGDISFMTEIHEFIVKAG